MSNSYTPSKNVLITYVLREWDRSKRITYLTTERYFERDVDRFAANLKDGQVLTSLECYSFEGDEAEVREFWRNLARDTTVNWYEKRSRLVEQYPNGNAQTIAV